MKFYRNKADDRKNNQDNNTVQQEAAVNNQESDSCTNDTEDSGQEQTASPAEKRGGGDTFEEEVAHTENHSGETDSDNSETEETALDAEPDNNIEAELDAAKRTAADMQDKYIRLAAEFDNYRRRVAKEKLELTQTASEDVIMSLLPVVDDFERAVDALKDIDDSDAAKQGTILIYNKMMDILKNKGVTVIKAIGEDLDTDEHEAVAQLPAPDSKLKGKVIDIAQQGYKLNGKVIRFAKVVIGI